MIRQDIAELQMIEQRGRRELERESALRAELRDTTLSAENQAALDRGDRQRATGIYEQSMPRYAGRYLGTLSKHWPRAGAESQAERLIFWRLRSALGPVLFSDYGKRVYELNDVVQVENDEQRAGRLGQ